LRSPPLFFWAQSQIYFFSFFFLPLGGREPVASLLFAKPPSALFLDFLTDVATDSRSAIPDWTMRDQCGPVGWRGATNTKVILQHFSYFALARAAIKIFFVALIMGRDGLFLVYVQISMQHKSKKIK
jgi:hypothetical protein